MARELPARSYRAKKASSYKVEPCRLQAVTLRVAGECDDGKRENLKLCSPNSVTQTAEKLLPSHPCRKTDQLTDCAAPNNLSCPGYISSVLFLPFSTWRSETQLSDPRQVEYN